MNMQPISLEHESELIGEPIGQRMCPFGEFILVHSAVSGLDAELRDRIGRHAHGLQ
jgi:hypothetical protein